ncbi:hypothetical protein DY000_02047926 [Brassica cretica]|uniref:Uncharacterized protein n=1 Tax=Brassica cretica TaxID=69181 RepID=A0ABQ7ERJ8_BRACR|nr:hypothetical protein DY000_02047926 [Brassica cretica]
MGGATPRSLSTMDCLALCLLENICSRFAVFHVIGGSFTPVSELGVYRAELLGALLQLLGVFVELLLQALDFRGELGISLLPSFMQLGYLTLQTIELPLEFGFCLGSPYRKFSFSRRKGAVSGTEPGVLRSGEPGCLLAGTQRPVRVRPFDVDRHLVFVVDRYFQRKRFQLGSIALALVHLQVADWSSLLSLNKLMSVIGFELHSSGLLQCFVNALDMSKAGINRRSTAVVVWCSPVVVDQFHRDVLDRCRMF